MEFRSKSYSIDINPISWQRAKLNGARLYDGQTKEKICFGLLMAKQHDGAPLFDRPIFVDVTFYILPSKLLKGKKGPTHHSRFPDIDNLCKFLFDSMKNVVITDDKIISILSAKKLYDKSPRTVFTITEIE